MFVAWSRNEQRQWTVGFWDDWLREPTQRKGRSCIYPETNRVYTFGSNGASHGKFFNTWLKDVQLNEKNMVWDTVDVNRLLHYDNWLSDRLREAAQVSDVKIVKATVDTQLAANAVLDVSEIMVEYDNLTDLTVLMVLIGLMYDHKAGLLRTSYQGVLQFRYRGVRIWIVPGLIDTLQYLQIDSR